MNRIIFVLFSIFLVQTIIQPINGQTSTSPQPISTTPQPIDIGGKFGNPGALIRYSIKALDTIYTHAMEMIARSIRDMVIPDVIVPLGGGMLTIKSVRVTEAKLSDFERQLIPPNQIRSRLSGGRIVSIGQWQYRPMNGARQVASGVFRTLIVNAALNVTKQLGRTWDAKPMVQVTDCKAFLGQFRVEIEGFGDNTTVIDQCDNLLCKRIRTYFEDAVCGTARNYIKNIVNQKLSIAHTKINLGPSGQGNRFVLDYGLLLNEPKVSESYIQGYLEGEVLSRGSVGAPFHADELAAFNGQDQSMISFALSDYAFNTLLHHAHTQQYRFSAIDHIQPTSPIKDLLKLECTNAVRSNAPKRPVARQSAPSPSPACLGSVFDNTTLPESESASAENGGHGDLVFKSQRPLQVVVKASPTKSVFGVDGGLVEAYGPAGADGKRELLGRAEIQWLRGEFAPKLSTCNVSGTVTITEIKLTRFTPTPVQTRRRELSDTVLAKLAQLSVPVLTETFNSFFNQFAQFPVPLIHGYACEKPQLSWMERTIRIDADVRVQPDAYRVIAKQT